MHGGKDGGPNLVPLLDLVLQLIMFLMITANFVKMETFDESIHLPLVQQARPLELKDGAFVFLTLTKDGWLLGVTDTPDNKKEKDLDKVRTESKALLKAHLQKKRSAIESAAADKGTPVPKIIVVLRADADTPYYEVYNILDMCARAGYDDVRLSGTSE
jgi:biopolymer transport protein ExbD